MDLHVHYSASFLHNPRSEPAHTPTHLIHVVVSIRCVRLYSAHVSVTAQSRAKDNKEPLDQPRTLAILALARCLLSPLRTVPAHKPRIGCSYYLLRQAETTVAEFLHPMWLPHHLLWQPPKAKHNRQKVVRWDSLDTDIVWEDPATCLVVFIEQN